LGQAPVAAVLNSSVDLAEHFYTDIALLWRLV
jgi:hypothetical protein